MQGNSFLKLTLLSIGLVGSASAYEITLWENPDCTGASRYDNVWDNTCSTPSPGFSSVSVVGYGAAHQSAQFYRTNNCAGSYPLGKGSYWVDGGDADFQIGKCISFTEVANAAGSWST